MVNEISDLQARFIGFAKGMPAIAISWPQIQRDVETLRQSLAGTNPGKPSAYMGNVLMPVYGLAYSVFLETLTLTPAGKTVELRVKLTANVHPAGRPGDVIRSYVVETTKVARVSLELDETSGEVYWQEQGSVSPSITPAWGANADAILATTTIPAPQRDHYLDEVERQIIWLTGPSLVRLATGVLPRYKLPAIVPWLRFSAPLRVDLRSPHVLISASRATLLVGDCTPQTINIEPDPLFPYGHAIPAPTLKSDDVDLAVYAPRTRLVEFFANKLEPAILVSDSGGGTIKWSLAGAIGLKSATVDLLTAQGTSGVIAVSADIDFVAAARAWIDGPSGSRLSLASASVLGAGRFAADVDVTVDVAAGVLEAHARVTRSELPNVSWDVNTPLGWPLDAIAGEILNHVASNEVRKLAGTVSRIGTWEILGLPLEYLDSMGSGEEPLPHAEGLAGVSALVAVRRKKG